jgi:hypothetical protein
MLVVQSTSPADTSLFPDVRKGQGHLEGEGHFLKPKKKKKERKKEKKTKQG